MGPPLISFHLLLHFPLLVLFPLLFPLRSAFVDTAQASLDAAALGSGAPHLHYPNVPNLATHR